MPNLIYFLICLIGHWYTPSDKWYHQYHIHHPGIAEILQNLASINISTLAIEGVTWQPIINIGTTFFHVSTFLWQKYAHIFLQLDLCNPCKNKYLTILRKETHENQSSTSYQVHRCPPWHALPLVRQSQSTKEENSKVEATYQHVLYHVEDKWVKWRVGDYLLHLVPRLLSRSCCCCRSCWCRWAGRD